MEVKAKAKYIRLSPRKMRLVANIVRGLSAEKAIDQLTFVKKRAVKPIAKILDSALANAEHNYDLKKSNLYIKEIKIDEGPTLKRWKPRARGRATPIRKRTSHIELILAELVESGKTKAKKQKLEAPVKLGDKPKKDEGIKQENKDAKKKSSDASGEDEKGKTIIDPRSQGKGKYTRIEGKDKKGFVNKIFRRKSG